MKFVKEAFFIMLGNAAIFCILSVILFSCVSDNTRNKPDPLDVSAKYADRIINSRINSSFVLDITIPDNTVIDKGKIFTKTWSFRNSGIIKWKDFQLHHLRGDQLGAPESVSVQATPASGIVEISVFMKAPEIPGNYISFWRMMDNNGNFFGDIVFVSIRVK
jgi:next to BRCA1 gene 1 protein